MHRHRELVYRTDCAYPVSVVHLSGWLAAGGVSDVCAAVHDCLAVEPEAVIVDLAGLDVAGDGSASVFASLAREAAAWPGSTVVLAGAAPSLAAAIGRTGGELAVYPSVAAARAAVNSDGSRPRFRETLPASPIAAPAARRLLGRVCRSWSVGNRSAATMLDAAEVIITELVANAVRHAGSRVLLTLSLRGDHLQISVSDDSPDPPRPGTARAGDEGGRGLALVEALASTWGTMCLRSGKVVWARVAMPRA